MYSDLKNDVKELIKNEIKGLLEFYIHKQNPISLYQYFMDKLNNVFDKYQDGEEEYVTGEQYDEWLKEAKQYAYPFCVSTIKELKQEFTNINAPQEYLDILNKRIDTYREYSKRNTDIGEMTAAEVAILSNLPSEYCWIARNSDGSLSVFREKPDLYHNRTWVGKGKDLGWYDDLFLGIRFMNSPYQFRNKNKEGL